MALKEPKLILIDVDGTMVDSVPDLTYCVDESMKRLGLPRRGEDAVRLWVGNGVERLVKRSLLNRLEGEPDAELYNQALPIFLELYTQNTAERSCLFPGVSECLTYLASANYRLGCVTNKAERFTLPLLKTMGILEYFEIVISGDALPRQKPHPMPLLHAAEAVGVTPAQSLMVGDSKSDVEAARAAGFQIVCMSYGYNHGEDIRDYEPDAVIDSMAELRALLEMAV